MGAVRKSTGIDLTGGGKEDAVREQSALKVQSLEQGIDETRDAQARADAELSRFGDLGGAAVNPLQELLGMGPPSQALLDERARLESKLTRRRSNFTPIHEARLQEIDQLLESREELPELPQAVDLSALPQAPTAFDPTDVDNPIMDFLKEGFRGIREGAAGGGRVPDRDLVKFAQGTAATLAPQIQAQRFGQQSALRSQALGEQGTQFVQQGGLRGAALGEKQQEIDNLNKLLGLGQHTALNKARFGSSAAANLANLFSGQGTARGAVPMAEAAQGIKLGEELGEAAGLNDVKSGDALKFLVGG